MTVAQPDAFTAVRRSRQVLARLIAECVARAGGESILGVEVGVACGNTSAHLLREFPNLTLIMVDSWTSHAPDSPYAKTGDRRARMTEEQQLRRMAAARKAVDFARGRYLMWRCTSAEAAEVCLAADFVFIDASHAEEDVRQDLYLWFPKIKPGYLLCGHDYNADLTHKFAGVKRAVDRFVRRKGLTLHTDESSIWWTWKETTT